MCNTLIFTKKIKKYQTWGILSVSYTHLTLPTIA